MASDLFALVVALGLVILVFSWLRRWRRKRIARRWPVLDATVEAINLINRGHYTYLTVVDVSYSYTIDGTFYSGDVSVPGSWWRISPTDELVGGTIQVGVNPQNPSESAIVSTSLPGIDAAACPPHLGGGSNR